MALRMTQPAAASVAGRPRALLQPGCQVPRLLVAPGPGARAATAPEQQSPASSLVARAAASDERGMQMPELLEVRRGEGLCWGGGLRSAKHRDGPTSKARVVVGAVPLSACLILTTRDAAQAID